MCVRRMVFLSLLLLGLTAKKRGERGKGEKSSQNSIKAELVCAIIITLAKVRLLRLIKLPIKHHYENLPRENVP